MQAKTLQWGCKDCTPNTHRLPDSEPSSESGCWHLGGQSSSLFFAHWPRHEEKKEKCSLMAIRCDLTAHKTSLGLRCTRRPANPQSRNAISLVKNLHPLCNLLRHGGGLGRSPRSRTAAHEPQIRQAQQPAPGHGTASAARRARRARGAGGAGGAGSGQAQELAPGGRWLGFAWAKKTYPIACHAGIQLSTRASMKRRTWCAIGMGRGHVHLASGMRNYLEATSAAAGGSASV